MIEGKVDIKALSINEAWQGRRYKTPKYKDWERMILIALPKPPEIPLEGVIKAEMVFYLSHPLRSDVSNYVKLFEDCLVKKGFLKDDRYIFSLLLRKEKRSEEGIWFALENDEKENQKRKKS